MPIDVFVHSNPALCALVLYWVAKGYEKAGEGRQNGVLFPWGILSLAIVCSTRYRERLPGTTNSRLTLYFNENVDIRAAIPSMMYSWRQPFWDGLRYGAARRMLGFTDMRVTAIQTRMSARAGLGDSLEKSASRLGKLLAREGSDQDLASSLGIGFEP